MSGWNNTDDGLLEADLDDDDFVDGFDDGEDEESPELEAGGNHPATDSHDAGVSHAGTVVSSHPHRAGGLVPRKLRRPPGRSRHGGKHRLRAMSQRMERTFPDVTSMLITRRDGSQILFVRKG